jgi:nicotinamidase-related amidase
VVPGSTLFLDVCAQRDFWPGGAWPIVTAAEAEQMAELFRVAAAFGVRQGGVVCLHGAPGSGAGDTIGARNPPAAGAPAHCAAGSGGADRAPGCAPVHPPEIAPAAALDRVHAYYVAAGCGAPIDAEPADLRVIDHLTAGIRDAVVFGAGVEYAMERAVDALLRRRVRTHVALDAAGAADAADAQLVIARWKRRTVDGATAATIARLLARGGAGP